MDFFTVNTLNIVHDVYMDVPKYLSELQKYYLIRN